MEKILILAMTCLSYGAAAVGRLRHRAPGPLRRRTDQIPRQAPHMGAPRIDR